MATYYRWRKSTVEYVASVDDSYSTGSLSIPNLDNNIYSCDNEPNIDENGKFITTASRDLTGEYTPPIDDNQWVSNMENPTEMYSCDRTFRARISGSNILLERYQPQGPQAIFKKTVVNTNIGTFVDYVYSTSSSAYPNGGVSGGYYYDQRTTVTSPTAPTGLTYPNPITTPTVTVSCTTGTSQIPNYTINRVEFERFTDAENAWIRFLEFDPSTNNPETACAILPGWKTIQFRARNRDSGGQWSAYTTGAVSNILVAPTLTVPQMVMQGQQATVSWTAIDGADSYTLQRKANTDTDWTQVYSGANLSYSETVGTWTSLQYRVQAVFSGTPGGWAESAAIPVVSASALVISGTDGDLGTVVNDVPYSISTDTGNQITATITVNSAVIFSGNVGNSTADTIPVLDLVNGEGTIVIEASVTASGGPVSAVRTWTYTKAPITFPNAGSVAQLTKEGENIFPKTLAECVRLPGGKTLDEVTAFPAQIYTGSYVGTGTSGADNPNELTFPFEPKIVIVTAAYDFIMIRPNQNHFLGVADNNYNNQITWNGNSVSWYCDRTTSGSIGQSNQNNLNYYYIAIG